MLQTIKQLIKCALSFFVLATGGYCALFALDAPSWLISLSILASILLAVSVVIYFI